MLPIAMTGLMILIYLVLGLTDHQAMYSFGVYSLILIGYVAKKAIEQPWKLDNERRAEIMDLRQRIQDVSSAIETIKRSGQCFLLVSEAKELRQEFLNRKERLAAFGPMIQAYETSMPHEVYRAYLLYCQHHGHVLSATSGTAYSSKFRENAFPPEKPIDDVIDILKEHESALQNLAVSLIDPISKTLTIPETIVSDN